MHESCILDFEQAIKLCEQSTGIAYIPEMFTQAEFQIFKSLDCELNMPTAFDLLMQVLYLEQDAEADLISKKTFLQSITD